MLKAFDSKQCPRLLYFNVQNVLHLAFRASFVGSSQFKPKESFTLFTRLKFSIWKIQNCWKHGNLPAATVNKSAKNKAKILKFIFTWSVCTRTSQLIQCFVLIFTRLFIQNAIANKKKHVHISFDTNMMKHSILIIKYANLVCVTNFIQIWKVSISARDSRHKRRCALNAFSFAQFHLQLSSKRLIIEFKLL